MNERKKSELPYVSLGAQLKKFRQGRQESLAEAAGAVEIDIETLEEIEQGQHRPSEDILLMLVSHFAVKDDDITKVWELAGYTAKDKEPSQGEHVFEMSVGNQAAMLLPIDSRVVYTDMVHVMVNNYGVVMNFLQGGTPNQPLTVARVGMSKEHARSVLEVLQKTLEQSEPKALPETTKPKQQDKKS